MMPLDLEEYQNRVLCKGYFVTVFLLSSECKNMSKSGSIGRLLLLPRGFLVLSRYGAGLQGT